MAGQTLPRKVTQGGCDVIDYKLTTEPSHYITIGAAVEAGCKLSTSDAEISHCDNMNGVCLGETGNYTQIPEDG